MTVKGILDLLGLIVGVAMVTTIVARPNSVAVVREGGAAFANAISAALGKGVNLK